MHPFLTSKGSLRFVRSFPNDRHEDHHDFCSVRPFLPPPLKLPGQSPSLSRKSPLQQLDPIVHQYPPAPPPPFIQSEVEVKPSPVPTLPTYSTSRCHRISRTRSVSKRRYFHPAELQRLGS